MQFGVYISHSLYESHFVYHYYGLRFNSMHAHQSCIVAIITGHNCLNKVYGLYNSSCVIVVAK